MTHLQSRLPWNIFEKILLSQKKSKSSDKKAKKYFYDKFIQEINKFAESKKIYNFNDEEMQIEFEKTKEIYNFQKKFNSINEMIEEMKKINNCDLCDSNNDIQHQDSFEYIIDLLFSNNIKMLLFIVEKGINFSNYYHFSFHQYYNDGVGLLIYCTIKMYISLNCSIICGEDFNNYFAKSINDTFYEKEYFYIPILKKLRNEVYVDSKLSSLDLLCLYTKNNDILKFLFDLLVNIKILEIKSNNVLDWYMEYEQSIQSFFELDENS